VFAVVTADAQATIDAATATTRATAAARSTVDALATATAQATVTAQVIAAIQATATTVSQIGPGISFPLENPQLQRTCRGRSEVDSVPGSGTYPFLLDPACSSTFTYLMAIEPLGPTGRWLLTFDWGGGSIGTLGVMMRMADGYSYVISVGDDGLAVVRRYAPNQLQDDWGKSDARFEIPRRTFFMELGTFRLGLRLKKGPDRQMGLYAVAVSAENREPMMGESERLIDWVWPTSGGQAVDRVGLIFQPPSGRNRRQVEIKAVKYEPDR
jgi:hypothetical protein